MCPSSFLGPSLGPRFAHIPCKISHSAAAPFKRMLVKVKKEIKVNKEEQESELEEWEEPTERMPLPERGGLSIFRPGVANPCGNGFSRNPEDREEVRPEGGGGRKLVRRASARAPPARWGRR